MTVETLLAIGGTLIGVLSVLGYIILHSNRVFSNEIKFILTLLTLIFKIRLYIHLNPI